MSSNLHYLYPRLPQHIAQGLAAKLVTQTPTELSTTIQNTHAAATFAPTGGNRISRESLDSLRAAVLSLARQYGHPTTSSRTTARSFDIECGILLHKEMRLHPSEASHNEVWSFLACVLMPDIVRWRFEDSGDSVRYVGRERGMRRHVFGRLWWRAYLAHNANLEEPYKLLHLLNEDDFVQVTERSSIAMRPSLFRNFCFAFAESAAVYSSIPRRDLIREASKRMYRLLSLIAVEALSEQELRTLTNDVFTKTATALLQATALLT